MIKECKCAHWLLRLAFAAVFIYHGLTKFPGAAGMAEMMQMPVVMIYLLAALETLAGILILVGGFGIKIATRLAGLFIVPIMLVAIFKFHWGQWNFLPSVTHPMGGIEFQVVLLAMAAYFLLRGNEE